MPQLNYLKQPCPEWAHLTETLTFQSKDFFVTIYIILPRNSQRIKKKIKKTAAYDIIVMDDKNNLIASCQSIVYRMEKPLSFLEK